MVSPWPDCRRSSVSLLGPVLAIVGPTASGKSALADAVASRLDTSVISVDAMQVYRGMDIGTAKTPAEERPVMLEMVDVCDVADDYSVSLFQQDARSCVDRALASNKIPVLCGGTGLYLNAVIDRMEFPSGEKGDTNRSKYEALAVELGPQGLYRLLEDRDPRSAGLIHPNNVRRVIRALEMLDEGVSYAEHHEGLHQRAPYYEATIWGISMNRERLYERIEQRVDSMFKQGLVEEVQGLLEHGLRRESTAGQAIGYKELIDYFDGVCTLEEAADQIKIRTRHYAKRQISWFKRDGRVTWLDMDSLSLDDSVKRVCDSIHQGLEA